MLAEEKQQQSPGMIERAGAFRLLITGSMLLVVLCLCAPTPLHAQTPSDQAPAQPTPTPAQSPTPRNADVPSAGNTIAGGDKPAAAGQEKADPWGPVQTKDVS